MRTHSVVLVSNRLPVSVTKSSTGELTYNTSAGGLATAMSSLEVEDKIWVGWPGIDDDALTDDDREQITIELEAHGCYPVFLSKQQVEEYYEGYSNNTLWPLFHYFQSLAKYSDDYWQAYQHVNTMFAKAVDQVAKTNARIWIHDYHFMLLPQMVRERVPGAAIGFFLHIPFPSFEIFRLLPERKQILRGLLGADIVGFHIFDYGRHFISSCVRLLGATVSADILEHGGNFTKVADYPIGIDYQKFRGQLKTKETKQAFSQIDESYRKQTLILSVDRLDYSKGIPERLEAFRILLENYPRYRGKVKLLMIAVPSRTNVDAYKSLRDEVEKTVSRINGMYGTVDWAPISYQFQNRPFAEIVALYARADIMLVTPIRDGMNLVAKEYVASKKHRKGVLVLSEMTGAVDDMPEAITINPNDAHSLVKAMNESLRMPVHEQKSRLNAMQKRLAKATVQAWGNGFMADLLDVLYAQHRPKKLLSHTQKQRIIAKYRSAKKRLIILDYDGTLKKFVKTTSPLTAGPSLRVRLLLKQFTDQPNTTVAIVSGRPKKVLSRWFVGLNVKLAAEHGGWRRFSTRWHHVENNFKKHKKQLRDIMDEVTSRTDGAEIEEKDYSIVWHYINVEPDLAYKRSQELKRTLLDAVKDDDIAVYQGHNIIEVKPVNVTKGNIVEELRRQFPADFVLCAGDDYTDEDMFRLLEGDRHATTIKIGNGETRARYQVEKVVDFVAFLESLNTINLKKLVTLPKKIPGRLRRWLN